jgi:hypothetical protein
MGGHRDNPAGIKSRLGTDALAGPPSGPGVHRRGSRVNLVARKHPGADTFRVDPQVVRYSKRPELWDSLGDLFDGVWPETGDYVFPAGLATVRINREQDTGEYWEPSMWLIHQVSPQAGR